MSEYADTPRALVVIPTYNRSDELARALSTHLPSRTPTPRPPRATIRPRRVIHGSGGCRAAVCPDDDSS